MEYIKVGNIANTHGIRGELKVRSFTDFEKERYAKGTKLYILSNNQYIQVTVGAMRHQKEMLLVTFENLKDINLVEKYKGCDLYIAKNDIASLKEGNYVFELIDCQVYCQDQLIGQVKEVIPGYQNVLRVVGDQREYLIPNVKAFVLKVDSENKRIDVNLIEGM